MDAVTQINRAEGRDLRLDVSKLYRISSVGPWSTCLLTCAKPPAEIFIKPGWRASASCATTRPSEVCGMKKRQDRSTEISIAFAMVALVAAILIVYFDTAHKLKLLDERIENIEMSGPQTK